MSRDTIAKMRRWVWCELQPFEDLQLADVRALLRRFDVAPIVAVRPWQLAELPGLLRVLQASGLSYAL